MVTATALLPSNALMQKEHFSETVRVANDRWRIAVVDRHRGLSSGQVAWWISIYVDYMNAQNFHAYQLDLAKLLIILVNRDPVLRKSHLHIFFQLQKKSRHKEFIHFFTRPCWCQGIPEFVSIADVFDPGAVWCKFLDDDILPQRSTPSAEAEFCARSFLPFILKFLHFFPKKAQPWRSTTLSTGIFHARIFQICGCGMSSFGFF